VKLGWGILVWCMPLLVDDQPHVISGRSTDETDR
jgi:hypothetical protein